MSKKRGGCGNCGNCGDNHDKDESCDGECNGKCGGKCKDKNCKCKQGMDEKGICTGGCGKKKDVCQCAKMKPCWICKRCGAMHKTKCSSCSMCGFKDFEEKKYLPAN